MHSNKLKIFTILGILALIIGLFLISKLTFGQGNQQTTSNSHISNTNKKSQPKIIAPYNDPKDLQPTGTWNKKSERKPYPNLTQVKDLWVRVSLKGNRTYIMEGKKPIYTMLSSGGIYHDKESVTPTGTYYIQEERGQKFYNDKLKEGARNYVSWKDHGIYLFHSVPTISDGKINKKEADKLGKTQGSHGCVRLSLPDSKWLMESLPVGTKVVIEDN